MRKKCERRKLTDELRREYDLSKVKGGVHLSSLELTYYANVDTEPLWVQMGATSAFSAGSSKPIPTCSATLFRNATSSFNLLYTSVTLLLA